MNYPRTRSYDQNFLKDNMMGPNAMILLEEMLSDIQLKPGMRILDLGCGKGLTSIFLAKEYGVEVIAYDLWIPAEDNQARFNAMVLGHLITAVHGDANDMPFDKASFDGVISVDSYHYYGCNTTFFSDKLKPLLKANAFVALAVPGMKASVSETIPEDMTPYWDEASFSTWQNIAWWQKVFKRDLSQLKVYEMSCYDVAWQDWLETDNPHALNDRMMIKTDGGRYMNLIAIIGRL